MVHHSQEYNCDGVKHAAFDSHVKCYVDNGFCDLAFGLEHPIQTAQFIADLCKVYQVKDFFSLIALKQIAAVVSQCAHQGFNVPHAVPTYSPPQFLLIL